MEKETNERGKPSAKSFAQSHGKHELVKKRDKKKKIAQKNAVFARYERYERRYINADIYLLFLYKP